jgi:Glycosyl hydrolases family 15
VPWVNRLDDGTITALAGPERVVLRTPVALCGEDLKTIGEFAVEAGQSVPFVLSHKSSLEGPGPPIDAFRAMERTGAFWREWSGRCPDVGPWTDAVKRSLITLKALTYAPSGGIVAPATTSLPEELGGVRNWDYRYCWLSDATFTLQAFMHLGYYDEARAWRDWIIRAVAGSSDQIQIMYGVGGERWLPESTVPWLSGYKNSSPVRVGNAAYQQLQIAQKRAARAAKAAGREGSSRVGGWRDPAVKTWHCYANRCGGLPWRQRPARVQWLAKVCRRWMVYLAPPCGVANPGMAVSGPKGTTC